MSDNLDDEKANHGRSTPRQIRIWWVVLVPLLFLVWFSYPMVIQAIRERNRRQENRHNLDHLQKALEEFNRREAGDADKASDKSSGR